MNKRGFSLLQVMIALALVSAFVFLGMQMSASVNQQLSLGRKTGTKSRILASIREVASLPASLRMSMRASIDGVAVNPELLACVGGNPANSCKSKTVHPFTLYSPILQREPDGTILGGQALTAPADSPEPLRIDVFGSPCKDASPDCPFLISTSFQAQCGPPLDSMSMVPQTQCTVADVIEVTYSIQLDPALSITDPSFAPLATPATQSVVVPVQAISGNIAQ